MDDTLFTSTISEKLQHFSSIFGISEKLSPLVSLIIIVLFSFLVAWIIYRLVRALSHRILKHKEYNFLSRLLEHNVLLKQAHIIPPIIINLLLPLIFKKESPLLHYLTSAVNIYFIIAVTMAVTGIISSIGEAAFSNKKYHDRPIKGFIQITRIIIYIITAIIIISILTNKSPLYLIGGLGAFAAVLMLITKDSIMGFVGGFLLLENDMIRLGDWIEVPQSPINGIVTDITLTTVKVKNFDNTIATIPPYTLINGSFINWRGVNESGGRRISRGYTIELNTIKPYSNELLERAKALDSNFSNHIDNIIDSKESLPETNAGLFRVYAEHYLNNHPRIHKGMLIMVRTLEPTGNGLPIQFYCFTNTTEWPEYEFIQSNIMEHFASIMPLFELFPYQNSSSRDTIISGLFESGFPIGRVTGLPYRTFHN
ncbi:MAG: mechanosensitive ion channel [Bacteroidaceae bacterium]|nr:mechanosensitive ion channel [Bacteroidaceae bacterium]